MKRQETMQLSQIPSMTALLAAVSADSRLSAEPRSTITPILRSVVEDIRSRGQAGDTSPREYEPAAILETVFRKIELRRLHRIRPVINATGILLHTGLGRSPLPEAAIERVNRVAAGYCNLEINLDDGQRGLRCNYAEILLRELTGAEAALIVNNNAAATLLALCALAEQKEVIVSRGQLIEIGGSYRLPDVMQAGGARLREVGTTNKTRVSDYERAIGENTALIMRVHTSNYRIVGFTAAPSTPELAQLAHRRGLLMYDDLGSGAMLDDAVWTAADEPTVPQALRDGADLVSFSGDKLLGGPQAGILLGARDVIEQLREHPMARALRVDKLTIAALEATLECYVDSDTARASIPMLKSLNEPITTVQSRAKRLVEQLNTKSLDIKISTSMEQSYAGGGSLPAWPLPTACVRCVLPRTQQVHEIAHRLRIGDPSVMCRIRDDAIVLDLRTISDSEVGSLATAIEAALSH